MRALVSVGLAFFAACSGSLASAAKAGSTEVGGVCKTAVKYKLSLDAKKDVTILGKRQNSEGFTVVDFKVSDGRKGSCVHYKSGKLSDVKMEPAAATPATTNR